MVTNDLLRVVGQQGLKEDSVHVVLLQNEESILRNCTGGIRLIYYISKVLCREISCAILGKIGCPSERGTPVGHAGYLS